MVKVSRMREREIFRQIKARNHRQNSASTDTGHFMPTEKGHLRLGLYGATFLGCLAIYIVTLTSQGLHADDAWMFVRYADHLLQDGVLSWNPGGDPTFGITSLAHLALITILRGLGFGHTSCLQLAVFLPALALVVLLLNEARRRLGESFVPHAVACALVLYFVSSASFRIHLTSGMDTILGILAAYLLAWSALLLQQKLSRRNSLRFHAAALLALATRPEMALFAISYSLGIWAIQWRSRYQVLIQVLVPQVVLAASGVAVLWLYFETPVPYTFYAKSLGRYEDLIGGYSLMPRHELGQMAISFAPFLVALVGFPPRRRMLQFLLPAQLLLIAYAFQIVWVMGYEGRFYMPVVGALWLLVIEGLALAAQRQLDERHVGAAIVGVALAALSLELSGGQSIAWVWLAAGITALIWQFRRPWQPALLLACLCMVVTQATWLQQKRPLKPDLASTQPFYFALSENLRLLASDLKIASTEHGYLGAINSSKTILDLAGLHDPVFARHFDTDRLFENEPDLILMPRWVYRGMIRGIENDDRFRQRYLYLSRDHPDIANACRREGIGVAILRDGRHRQALEHAVQHAARRALGRSD